jgi:bifunctional DNA-binding transcriptional regulator/antitoxin component of YhaV-PrlF toxin-antitoxin module
MSTNPYGTTTYKAKVTRRHAITLPAALCREMGIEVGDTVELEVNGSQAILRREDEYANESIRGILKGTFPDWESIAQFLEEERAGWDEKEALLDEMRSEHEKRSPG